MTFKKTETHSNKIEQDLGQLNSANDKANVDLATKTQQ
jgi:hypothetical protein